MARLIVMGNEKGGSGKSTTAMHLITALVRAGHAVGALDLDLRQKSLFRYLDNREDYMRRHGIDLPLPRRIVLEASTIDSRAEAEAEDQARFESALAELSGCDYIVVDCPGSYSTYSRLAHACADTLITPMNDSLVDFDMLARLDPSSGKIKGPSVYSEMVWKARQARARHRPAADGLGGAAQPHRDARRPQQAARRQRPRRARPPHRLPPRAGLLRACRLPRALPLRTDAARPPRDRPAGDDACPTSPPGRRSAISSAPSTCRRSPPPPDAAPGLPERRPGRRATIRGCR